MKSTLLWIKRLVKYCTCDTQDKRTVSELLLQNKPFQGDAKHLGFVSGTWSPHQGLFAIMTRGLYVIA